MITVYPDSGKPVWVDLRDPSPEEIAQACSDYGLEIPPREQLEEIEFSSRLQYDEGVFTLSVPVTPHLRNGDGDDVTSPLGFVLTKDMLVTVRFAHLHTFDAVRARVKRRPRSPEDIFLVILEALIDYGADRLEGLRSEALKVSQCIFHEDMQEKQKRNVSATSRMLRGILVQIGDMGERLSHIRDTLLVLQRTLPFVNEHGDWIEAPVKARLKMAGKDVQSLNDYEVHLTDKIQFLLDAALGFITAEQNDLFKVMTIWSLAGIPPVLCAGIWGMNFHFMPELSSPYGYPLALLTILVSILLPLGWFKYRGWW